MKYLLFVVGFGAVLAGLLYYMESQPNEYAPRMTPPEEVELYDRGRDACQRKLSPVATASPAEGDGPVKALYFYENLAGWQFSSPNRGPFQALRGTSVSDTAFVVCAELKPTVVERCARGVGEAQRVRLDAEVRVVALRTGKEVVSKVVEGAAPADCSKAEFKVYGRNQKELNEAQEKAQREGGLVSKVYGDLADTGAIYDAVRETLRAPARPATP